MRDYATIKTWRDVRPEEWNDWRWQFANRIETVDQLADVVDLTSEEYDAARRVSELVRMRISPHVITLMSADDRSDPVRRAFVPSGEELASMSDAALYDNVNSDDDYMPVRGLVHRYPSKVLIFPSDGCASYCRYCFRREGANRCDSSLSAHELQRAIDYIAEHPEIEEVILSGGDPLTLEDEELEVLLAMISRLVNVALVRIHTRVVVTVPQRVTDDLVNMIRSTLGEHQTAFLVIHVDCANEFSPGMKTAVSRLVDGGVPCFASSPLLKGINDDPGSLRDLWTGLLKIRVKPYYLFHSDPVKGCQHFMVPLEHGIETLRALYDRMSGLAMPLYCMNIAGGGGHVLVGLDYIRRTSPDAWEVRNFEGVSSTYRESGAVQ